MNELDPKAYTVVWIAPLKIEAEAALLMLDNRHNGRFSLTRGDDYIFHAGDLGGHNVVVVTLPSDQDFGTGAASMLASQTKKFFPNIWFGLLVGVAAGLPDLSKKPPRDIRLGDVLVGMQHKSVPGVIAYDTGEEREEDGFQFLHFGDALPKTEPIVLSATKSLRLNAPDDPHIFLRHYESIKHKSGYNLKFEDPGRDLDVLQENNNRDGHVILRVQRLDSERTRVWHGPIASSEMLMTDSQKRGILRTRSDVIGFEVGASGTMTTIPVGVIRGVSNYGGQHENIKWRPYAAAMAAAYAKAVLLEIRPSASSLNPMVKDESSKIAFRGIKSRLPHLTQLLDRETELSQMEKALGSTPRRSHLIVSGLIGSGKTQLAAQYVSTMREQYGSVLWIDASSSITINDAFEKFSSRMPPSERRGSPVEDVIEWLEYGQGVNSSWIMIFDGLPGVYDFEKSDDFDIRDYLPVCNHGHILLTTRASDLHLRLGYPNIHLGGLDDSAGSKIILRCANIEIQDDVETDFAKNISRELGGLPLALEQVGTYLSYGINFPSLSQCPSFLFSRKDLTSSMKEALQTPSKRYMGSYQKGRALWAEFKDAYDLLRRRSRLAIKLLQLVAWFDWDKKSGLHARASWIRLAPPKQAGMPLKCASWFDADPEEHAMQAISALEASGFVELNRSPGLTFLEACKIHQLTRSFVFEVAPKEEVDHVLSNVWYKIPGGWKCAKDLGLDDSAESVPVSALW